MDAIVMAGGIPLPEDPLYTYTQGNSKALLDIAGKPMVQWVLDALSAAKSVENVILIGLSAKSGVTCQKPIHFLPNQGRMLANIVAGVEKSQQLDPQSEYVMIVSSDVPGIKPEMIDWLAETCLQTHDDLYYGVVPREIMEKRYPNSRRTFTRLKDMEVCGADVNVTHVNMAHEHLDTWEQLIGNRKNPLLQARVIGLDTLFQLMFRQLSIDDIVQRVMARIGVRGRAIIWQHAEAGMDVDKPHQLEIMRADLSGRQDARA
ncbi:MAG: nucleotidyltransferase family protein [Anaerolineales bacterium]|jgi:GTP:adenosylcobinamide-phosphate guanylyltransferase|nr:nucleotidyltransferase family protein [Anaerolineales bacterium]